MEKILIQFLSYSNSYFVPWNLVQKIYFVFPRDKQGLTILGFKSSIKFGPKNNVILELLASKLIFGVIYTGKYPDAFVMKEFIKCLFQFTSIWYRNMFSFCANWTICGGNLVPWHGTPVYVKYSKIIISTSFCFVSTWWFLNNE